MTHLSRVTRLTEASWPPFPPPWCVSGPSLATPPLASPGCHSTSPAGRERSSAHHELSSSSLPAIHTAGRQVLTLLNGHRFADLLKVKHGQRLQNLLLLHSFFQKALLDHPRQIRGAQFLGSSPQCSRLAQNVPSEVSYHARGPHPPLPRPSCPHGCALASGDSSLPEQLGGQDAGWSCQEPARARSQSAQASRAERG